MTNFIQIAKEIQNLLKAMSNLKLQNAELLKQLFKATRNLKVIAQLKSQNINQLVKVLGNVKFISLLKSLNAEQLKLLIVIVTVSGSVTIAVFKLIESLIRSRSEERQQAMGNIKSAYGIYLEAMKKADTKAERDEIRRDLKEAIEKATRILKGRK
jgi:hypothetical protein